MNPASVAKLVPYAALDERYVLVAIVNHTHANAARPALDALLQWTINDAAAIRGSRAPSRSP